MEFPWERFGYHVVYDRDLYDAIEFASAHGFGFIVPDLMIPRFWPEEYDPPERRKIRRFAEDHGVSISFHAPSDNLNLSAPYPEVRAGLLRRMGSCLELARDLGAERFTVHPSQPSDFASGGQSGHYLEDHNRIYAEALAAALRGIVEMAKGVQICVENEPLTPFVEGVLEGLIAEGVELFLTLDVPKAEDPRKGAPVQRVEAFYSRNVDRIREAHLHDRRPGGRFHDALGHGEVDFRRYLELLAPLDVHFNLEIRPREDAYSSLQWLRALWKEIF